MKWRWLRIGVMLLMMLTGMMSPVLVHADLIESQKLSAKPPVISKPAQKWDDTIYDRPEEYSSYTTQKDVFITMRDGTILAADVHIPNGPGPFPVILTQTPYSKNSTGAEHRNEYFIKRGYVHMVIDVRGTGSSQGIWDSFGPMEQQDGKELVEWASSQPWSNGNVGLYGSSYRGINQIFTAAYQPKGLKAIFPIVPMGDAYRDIMMSGGLINTGFIPLWLGLVTSSGLMPPTYTLTDPVMAGSVLLKNIGQITGFPVTTLSSALTGGDFAYDGTFFSTRSPLQVVNKVKVPAFFTGGLHDIFQRGTPLLYEKLKSTGVPSKLLIGNWTHLTYGDGLPANNVPALEQIALRWFDKYLKNMNTNVERIPDVTQYVLGENQFETQADWPNPQASAQKLYLRGGRLLTKDTPSLLETGTSMLQQPLNGICSGSSAQWTAGALGYLPCTKDNRLTELAEITYTTPILNSDLKISGPIAAKIFAKTTANELVLTVRVTDVAPDGTSSEITAGWLAASHRAVDGSKSRNLNGENVQPWHPFTREALQEVKPGEVMELNVEIFPTNVVIKEGHRLRVAIGPSDFPHSMSPAPSLLNQLGGIATILNSKTYPSHIILPVVP